MLVLSTGKTNNVHGSHRGLTGETRGFHQGELAAAKEAKNVRHSNFMVLAPCKNTSSRSRLFHEECQSRDSYLYTQLPSLYLHIPPDTPPPFNNALDACVCQFPSGLAFIHDKWKYANWVTPLEVTLLTVETASWREYS